MLPRKKCYWDSHSDLNPYYWNNGEAMVIDSILAKKVFLIKKEFICNSQHTGDWLVMYAQFWLVWNNSRRIPQETK